MWVVPEVGNDWSLSGVSGPNTCTLNLSHAHNLEQFLLKIIPNQTGEGTLGPICQIVLFLQPTLAAPVGQTIEVRFLVFPHWPPI